ncbi:hypothetical protein [Modestobacter sp. VKM Ac-2984]|uniref:hypothetical protein n=1 Tax=Modestobacter sp. VKM Ac-2984 TaxID=3004138 RepID=UPI0022AA0CFC|nr:hypothetical protein [Modestobacter sp. VKM Ac-2984]MCZ2817905.1 hypothetical protein [Modestobacter sp. VKM Ac-2984]
MAVRDAAGPIDEASRSTWTSTPGPPRWRALDAAAERLGERAGLSPVADDIAGTRAAVRELIELMTHTRAPLATPVDAP